MSNNITPKTVLEIRAENKRLITNNHTRHGSRYKALASKFGVSEWSARWICQGREHVDAGGYIESYDHEGHYTRAISNSDALDIREDFMNLKLAISDISTKYAVSDKTIVRLLLGKTYRDIGGPIFTNNEVKACLRWKPKKAKVKNIKPQVYKNLVIKGTSILGQKKDQRSITTVENKLTPIDVYFIRSGYQNGNSIQFIQDKYNLSRESVIDILNGTIFSKSTGPIQSIKA